MTECATTSELARDPRLFLHDRGRCPPLSCSSFRVTQAPLPDRSTRDPRGHPR